MTTAPYPARTAQKHAFALNYLLDRGTLPDRQANEALAFGEKAVKNLEAMGYDFHADFRAAAMPCRVCGDTLTPGGVTCARCEAGIEYDRLERESAR